MFKQSTTFLFVFGALLLACHYTEAKKLKEKPKNEAAEVVADAAAKQDPLKHPHEEFNHELNHEEFKEPKPKKLSKPKSLKVLTEYDKCKMECKRQRDMESAHEYVERLREELKLAEQQLAGHDEQVIEV